MKPSQLDQLTGFAPDVIAVPLMHFTMIIGVLTNNPYHSGSTTGGENRTPGWQLDGTTVEAIAGLFPKGIGGPAIPATWSSFHVDIDWLNAGAGAGNVAFRGDHLWFNIGDSTDTETQGSVVLEEAPVQYVMKRSRLLTSIPVSAAKEIFRLQISRRPGVSNVGDTLTNDVAVTGVRLVKA